MTTCCDTTRELDALIKRAILTGLSHPAFRKKLQTLFCEMVASGELCLNLPDALEADNSQHTIRLTTTSGYDLIAHLGRADARYG